VELSSPITELKGVGDEVAKKLAILGIHNISDLVENFQLHQMIAEACGWCGSTSHTARGQSGMTKLILWQESMGCAAAALVF
jgi:nucleotidyltransferase/DNA polymerase involved in DNA repair